MTTSYNDMPMVECPHCGGKFQWDDYYDIAPGDTRDCPLCEKLISVLYVDVRTYATLDTQRVL